MNNSVKHWPVCTGTYPEKSRYEPAQLLTADEISDTEVAWTCVDCGAYIILPKEPPRR